ncbi:MAG: pantetheine-phosphate adenylyltransferase [Syntrophobacteraceae bacterium]
MVNLAVYPGSFDPITNGHLDLLERGLKVFDKILVAIAENAGKKPLFSLKERIALIEESLRGSSYEERIEVVTFQGLLVDYVKRVKAKAILRGLRAISDFEYEFPMSLMNRNLNEEVETFFLMTGLRYSYISSTIIKEVVISGGSVSGMVPEPVERKLKERFLKTSDAVPEKPRIVVSRVEPKRILHKMAS